MPAESESSADARAARLLFAASTAGAVVLAFLRGGMHSHYTLLLGAALTEPTSLLRDPLVQAALGAIYTVAPRALGVGAAWLSGAAGLELESTLPAITAVLWTAEAALSFRFFRALTGRADAAALATLLTGLEVPLMASDSAYSLQKVERALGMLPLLVGLRALVERRLGAALAGILGGVYLHANPSMYVLPLWGIEVLLDARRTGRLRRAASLLFVSFLGLLPLGLSVLKGGGAALSSEYVLMAVNLHVADFRGDGALADQLLRFQGVAWIGLAAWHARRLESLPLALRGFGVCAAFCAVGAATFAAGPAAPGWSVVTRMGPWLSLFLVDIFGLPLLCLWLVREIEAGKAGGLSQAFVLGSSFTRDIILRAEGLAIAALSLLGRPRAIGAAVALAAALALVGAAARPRLLEAARAAGLRGGFLDQPAFHATTAVAFLASSAAARFAIPGHAVRTVLLGSLAAIVPVLPAQRRWLAVREGQAEPSKRLGGWIRAHTPADSVVLISPMTAVPDCVAFLLWSRRSSYACPSYFEGAIAFGRGAAPMEERLRALGLRFDYRLERRFEDMEDDIASADRALTPRRARSLLGEVPAYLLGPARPDWPLEPVAREGDLFLYPIPPG
ncbi:MAG: hypothetical protein HY554_06035 [Elusimicrobia bacterium]|nr:hypothetical protein [Elusimicrobiota bacterium]